MSRSTRANMKPQKRIASRIRLCFVGHAALRAAPVLVALVLVALVLVVPVRAGQEDASVVAGKDGLDTRLQIPWYDSDADALQPIPLPEPWPWWKVLGDWLRPLGRMSADPLYVLMWIVIIAVLLVVAWYVYRAIRERRRSESAERDAKIDKLVAADRVEALPFLRKRSHDDLLGQARRCYEQGDYGEAIIYLFSYELVELDRHALVRLAKGKTNRQYLREARRAKPLARMVERTMVAFEDVFFGRKHLDRDRFEACWHELGQFESLLLQTQQSP